MGGDGQDFINGGANDNEAFAGPGNDFVIAGQGADAVVRRRWRRLDPGRHRAGPAAGRPRRAVLRRPGPRPRPGNDVFVGQVGENDYDAEGGDDVMAQNAAVDRNAGAGGFDWAIHQYDTVGADDDMEINNNLGGLPIQVVVNRDRWQETEADSGSAFDDVIRGTDGAAAPSAAPGSPVATCSTRPASTASAGSTPARRRRFTGAAAPVVAASAAASARCPGPSGATATSCSAVRGSDTITVAAATTSSTATAP